MGRRAVSRQTWTLTLAALTAGFGGCSSTYGTGEAPEMALFREMTGGFLNREKKEPIAYQPRAPLVMPPSAGELPPPIETAAVATAEWPNDPDQQARAAKGFDSENPREDIDQAEYRRLKPLTGMLPSAPRTERESDMHDEAYDIVRSKQQREQFKQALAESKGYARTERRYLTDPPTTYREPTATAPTEFEEIQKKKGFFLTRWLSGGS